MSTTVQRLAFGLSRLPNLLRGYNLYVKPEKLRLLHTTFDSLLPGAASFADLGGVWRVEAGYTRYVLRTFARVKGTIVDRSYSPLAEKLLSRFSNVRRIQGNFTDDAVVAEVGVVDVVVLFDVLLHQVKPDWNEVIAKYAPNTRCFVIYNQQIADRPKTVRLTDLPLDECSHLAPRTDDLYEQIYAHRGEMNQEHGRLWQDIIDPWQWGITDDDLRDVLKGLGFGEVYYRNYGKYGNLRHFENHGFVFVKK